VALSGAFLFHHDQERPDPKTDVRWVDRIVPDGTWSGNLYDYFQKAYRKLTSDVKIPFKLKEVRVCWN
jgi:hypothetical protein